MSDFITRLAERALGVAPVVQPVLPSAFAPEPTGQPMGLEWDEEVPASSDDPGRPTSPPAAQTPTLNTVKEIPQDTMTSEREEEQEVDAYIAPPRTLRTSDVSPEPPHPAISSPLEPEITSGREDRGTATLSAGNPSLTAPETTTSDPSEGEVVAGREDRRDLSSATPGSPPRTPGSRPEPAHPSEPDPSEHRTNPTREDRRDSSQTATRRPRTPSETLQRAEPTRRNAVAISQPGSPENLPLGPPPVEDEPGQDVSRPLRAFVDHGRDEALPSVSSPDTQASSDAGEGTPEPEASLDRPERPDASPLLVPRMVRPRLDDYPERGLEEPAVAAPEPSVPDIRVSIGRIEVRAIMPPPMPPTQRPAPAQPRLSLDDYLKQRNGGQR